jgi:hypothetical protein
MDPRPAWPFTADTEAAAPGERRRSGGPCPIDVHRCASVVPFSCFPACRIRLPGRPDVTASKTHASVPAAHPPAAGRKLPLPRQRTPEPPAPVRTTVSRSLRPPRCSAGPSQRNKTPCTNSAGCGEGGASAGALHGGDKTPCTNSARHSGQQASQCNPWRQTPHVKRYARPVSRPAGRAPRHERPEPHAPIRRGTAGDKPSQCDPWHTGLLPAWQRRGPRHSKQDSTQMQQGYTLNARMGPGAGALLHSRHRPTEPGEPPPLRLLLSYSRVQRPSACICVNPCLLRREPLDAASGGRRLAARRQEPHAPVQAAVPSARACSVAACDYRKRADAPGTHLHCGHHPAAIPRRGGETPHVQRAVARPALPTVSPGVQLRRW